MRIVRWQPETPTYPTLWDHVLRSNNWNNSWNEGQENHPRIEVKERGDEILVRADIPGVDPKDIDLKATQDTLTIKGEMQHADKDDQEEGFYHHSERHYGTFFRTIDLPAEVKTEGIKAQYKHGVLEVHLPKHHTHGVSKRIPIDMH